MQDLAKLLVIEDSSALRLQLSTILDFLGEQAEYYDSNEIDVIDWSKNWSGCILGSLGCDELSSQLSLKLQKIIHIPLLA